MTAQPSPSSPSLRSRRQLSSHGPEAEALLEEVRASVATLSGLLAHQADLGEPVTAAVRSAVDEVEGRLARRELRVVVAGEPRAGKSTLLDALLGERLLGLTGTPPNAFLCIRRARERGYRARFANGTVETWERRMPDRTPELEKRITTAQAFAEETKRRCDTALRALADTGARAEKADRSLQEAFRAFEAARGEAAQLGTDFENAEQQRELLEDELAGREKKVPAVLRKRIPWWAPWLFLFRLVAWLFAMRPFRGYRRLLAEREDLEADVVRLRAETTTAAERCTRLEADLAPAHGPVEEARQALEEARGDQRDAAAAWEGAERAVGERQRDLEREREERIARFAEEVRKLCDPEGRGKELIELEIAYPARILPEDVAVIEAPGATVGDDGARERALRMIAEQADGCILVSEMERAVSGATMKFLQEVREAVPHAVLVLTKMDELAKTDRAFRDAMARGEGEAWERVEQARRIGTRRFAREVGRDADTVLSVAVAAEQALREGEGSEPARQRFETDVERLFVLLRRERALILGARSAGIVRRCIGGVRDAEARARAAYEARIAALESERIPGPERFQAELMQTAEPALLAAAGSVVESTLELLRETSKLVRVECAQRIAACATREELRAVVPVLEATIVRGFSGARDAVRDHLDRETERAVGELEKQAFQALRERYQLLHELTRDSKRPVRVHARWAEAASPTDLAPGVEGAIQGFVRLRTGLGLGGAAVGAAVGTMLLPGIGSAVGAAVGALATFAKTRQALRRDCLSAADRSIATMERPWAELIRAAQGAIATAIRATLERSLTDASSRFARWIAEPLDAEREAIESERAKLRDLEALRERLHEHDGRLEDYSRSAAGASIGLFR